MENEEFSEWFIIKWLGDQFEGDISISRRARDDLKRRLTDALRQVYEQRPKVEISFPTLEEVMSSYGTGLTAPEWKVGIESCYYYLKANTKINDVENEKV